MTAVFAGEKSVYLGLISGQTRFFFKFSEQSSVTRSTNSETDKPRAEILVCLSCLHVYKISWSLTR